jgi:hypothetical protein
MKIKSYFGTLLSLILGVLFFVLFVPLMAEKFYLNRINVGMQYVANSPMAIPYMIAALFLFITLYWLISKKGLLAYPTQKGLMCYLPNKLRFLVGVVAVVFYFFISCLYVTCYNQIDDTGFKKNRFFVSMHYRYEDVEYYRLYAQSDGTLGLAFYLNDGSKIEYYTSIVSSNVDDTETYAVALAQKLNALDVKCKIVNEEKLHKRLSYDYWKETAEQIIDVSDVVEEN